MAHGLGARCAVRGGKISGPKGTDNVPLQGTAGEYVLPVKTVKSVGVHALDELVRQTNGKEPGPKMVRGAAHAVDGGQIMSSITDTASEWLGFGANPKPMLPVVAPTPTTLGTGLAANAATALSGATQRVDSAVDKAVNGYANGGVVEPEDTAGLMEKIHALFSPRAASVLTAGDPGAMAGTALRQYGVPAISAVNDAAGAPMQAAGQQFMDFQRGLWGASQGVPTTGASATAPAVAPMGAVPTPTTAVAPLNFGGVDELTQGQANLRAANPPQFGGTPLTAADVTGTAVPQPGTGAFVNNATGKVTNLSTPASATGLGANSERWVNRAEPGSLASFFGAAMNQKQAATQEAAARAAALKLPETAKNVAEATAIQQRIALAASEADPVKKAAILAGHNPPESKAQIPLGNQPMTGADKTMVVYENGVAKSVPIQQPPQATIESLQAYAKAQGKTMTPAQLRNMAAAQGIAVTN